MKTIQFICICSGVKNKENDNPKSRHSGTNKLHVYLLKFDFFSLDIFSVDRPCVLTCVSQDQFVTFATVFQGTNTPDRSMENDIELAASLATLNVLQKRGVNGVKVKWLNDLWIHGHKLLGALAEFKSLIKGGSMKLGLCIHLDSNV